MNTDKRIYTMKEEKPVRAVIKMGVPVTMGIANKIMSFGNYIYQGMAAGCQTLMGYNYGAKNYGRMAGRHKTVNV